VFLHREVGGGVGSGIGGVVVGGLDWGGDLEHFEWSDDVYWINIDGVVPLWSLGAFFFFFDFFFLWGRSRGRCSGGLCSCIER
jgi:hypothetical protein